MTRPRCIIAGGVYLITRRACQRMFRLRPCSWTNRILMYCLACAAARTGISVFAYVCMSNYHQIVLCDPQGKLPVFLHLLHLFAAKALNAFQGEVENLWAAEHTSVVRLASTHDTLAKIAYVAANPVNAGLVPRPDDWPGVVLWRPGSRVIVTRPDVYFGLNFPEQLELRVAVPTDCNDPQRWTDLVHSAVDTEVRKARASVQASGLSFLGRDRVLKASFMAKAKSYEQKRGINPRLAAKDITTRRAFLRAQKLFHAAYRAALDLWRAGDRSVAFPFGTWWMSVHHGAAVAPGLA
ncbi:MAG: hypothetical protein MUF54_09175 [Polyangiaceae bacterium]|jgi:hypothetical protein|nr:hypothetical protein [Polyangiaceae bacterium]